MRHSLIQLTLIHFREFVREPETLFWSIIFPVLMAWVLGIAFSGTREQVQTIALVTKLDGSAHELQTFLQSSSSEKDIHGHMVFMKSIENEKIGKTTYRFVSCNWDTAVLMLKRGETNLILEESSDSLYFHFDPQSPDGKLLYLTLSSALRGEKTMYNGASIKPLTTIGTRYIDFLVPGLLAMGLMNSLVWGISYGLIEMRVKKLLRRMIATPMKKSEFLVSYFIARYILSSLEALILFSFSTWYFHVSIQGSILAALLLFTAGNIVFAGISILLSSRVENTRVGNGMINFLLLPMTVLSGIFFSYHNFPDAVIPVIQVLPLTVLADGLRSIFIEGAGIWQTLPAITILTSLGIVSFAIGLRIFKWY